MMKMTLKNGLEMPLVGLGTWDLNGETCVRTVSEALKLGYRLIDTAHMYHNEREVGLGIRASGIKRSDIFITTKMDRSSASYTKARQAIDEALVKLGVDYIDLFLLHEPYPQGPEMYRALEEAYDKGQVRAIGISNYDPAHYEAFIQSCRIIPMINQVEAHIYFQKTDFQKAMAKNGTCMQAWAPLGQGKADITRHPLLTQIGQAHQKTAAQVALRFLVQRGVGVIPKSKHVARLKENLDLFDFDLSSSEMQAIVKLDKHQTFFSWTEMF